MLLAVNKEVLDGNPKFEALYRDLCNNKLQVDGTTKPDGAAQKDRDAFNEELRRARVTAAKQQLIKSHLQALAHSNGELPPELQELVTIIAAVLLSQVSREDSKLLREDIDRFRDHVKPIAKEIWKAALDDLVTLARIASPQAQSDGDDLSGQIAQQRKDVARLTERLASVRLEIAHAAADVHDVYREAIEASIRVLEQTVHGSVSRSTRAKAEYLATVAEGMSKKLQLQRRQVQAQTNSGELQKVLQAKVEELNQESFMLRRRIREAEDNLAEYQEARALGGMASEYAALLEKKRRVMADISRLQGSS